MIEKCFQGPIETKGMMEGGKNLLNRVKKFAENNPDLTRSAKITGMVGVPTATFAAGAKLAHAERDRGYREGEPIEDKLGSKARKKKVMMGK